MILYGSFIEDSINCIMKRKHTNHKKKDNNNKWNQNNIERMRNYNTEQEGAKIHNHE